MNRSIVVVIIIVAIILIIGIYAAFLSNPGGTSTSTSSSTTSSETSTTTSLAPSQTTQGSSSTSATPTPSNTAPAAVTISIRNFSFNPGTLTVKAGTKITWVNNDSVPHTVTADSGTSLNSSPISPGKAYTVTLTDPGTISYHCSIHPSMHGTVIVQ